MEGLTITLKTVYQGHDAQKGPDYCSCDHDSESK
jgi:hypothetical protein